MQKPKWKIVSNITQFDQQIDDYKSTTLEDVDIRIVPFEDPPEIIVLRNKYATIEQRKHAEKMAQVMVDALNKKGV